MLLNTSPLLSSICQIAHAPQYVEMLLALHQLRSLPFASAVATRLHYGGDSSARI